MACRDAAKVFDWSAVPCDSKSFSPRFGIVASSFLSKCQYIFKCFKTSEVVRYRSQKAKVLCLITKIHIIAFGHPSRHHILIDVGHISVAVNMLDGGVKGRRRGPRSHTMFMSN